MKNLIARLMLFFIGIPGLIAAALLFPYYLYAPLALLIIVFSAGSAHELFTLLALPKKPLYYAMSIVGGIVPPLTAYITGLLVADTYGTLVILSTSSIVSAAMFFLFASLIIFIKRKDTIASIVQVLINLLFITVYPGILSAMLIALLSYKLAGFIILWFAAIVFSNDSFAWLFGMTIGKHRGIFVVSSNKSLEGFLAGIAGSMLTAIIIPYITPIHKAFSFPLWSLAVLGLLSALAGVVGDLFESALKRSANLKDSGNTIPGRGGFLDSFDSVLATVPVFSCFLLMNQLFQ